jgi:hypothetical protein
MARLLRCSKGYRRIYSHVEKLEAVFLGFLCFAMILEASEASRQSPVQA